jgi:hypothetical protein
MSIFRSETQLFDACRVLFPGALIEHEFLRLLQLQSVKSGYRKLAKKYHPDCCSFLHDTSQMAEMFQKVNLAYQLLCSYIRDRDLALAHRPYARPSATMRDTKPRKPGAESAFRPRQQNSRPAKPARNPSDVYYDGPLPDLPLKLGLFLYYKGVVPYSAVVKALIWQRDMRPPIGELAVAWGWLEPYFISVIQSATEISGNFGERAVQLGLLPQSQIAVLVLQQKLMQAHTGTYFVGKGYVTEYELNQYLRELIQFNKQRTRWPRFT